MVEPDALLSTPVDDLAPLPLAQASAECLEPFLSLRRAKGLERSGRFVAEGGKVVQRLLASPHPVEAVLLTPDWLERLRPVLLARQPRPRVVLAPDREAVTRLTGFHERAGLKALGRLAQRPSLEGLLAPRGRPRLLVALDGITNAENVGVVVRNAAAFGVDGLLVGETACSPFLTRAIGASMGASFVVPVVEDMPLVAALARVRAAGLRVLATEPEAVDSPVERAGLAGDTCLVLGAEGEGISAAVRACCDGAVSVPMPSTVDSLNVSSAAAVFLYEAWRQRRTR